MELVPKEENSRQIQYKVVGVPYCRCGLDMEINCFTADMQHIFLSCPKRRWWNFWKHDAARGVARPYTPNRPEPDHQEPQEGP